MSPEFYLTVFLILIFITSVASLIITPIVLKNNGEKEATRDDSLRISRKQRKKQRNLGSYESISELKRTLDSRTLSEEVKGRSMGISEIVLRKSSRKLGRRSFDYLSLTAQMPLQQVYDFVVETGYEDADDTKKDSLIQQLSKKYGVDKATAQCRVKEATELKTYDVNS